MDAFSAFAFALIQLVISCLSSLLQCTTLPLFLLYSDYRSRVSSQMLFSLGLFDCSQTLTHVVCAAFFAAGSTMPRPIERVNAAINLVGWNGLVLQHLLLALNRWLVFVWPFYRPVARNALLKMLQAALWLWYLATVVLFLTPLMGGSFQADFVGYSVDTSFPYSHWFNTFYAFTGRIVPLICVSLYASIFITLRRNRDRLPTSKNEQVPQMSKAERHLLVQAVILFSGLLALDYGWPSFRLGQQIYIFAALLYCGLNPVLYLAMGTEFRHRFLRTYRWTCMEMEKSVVLEMDTHWLPPDKNTSGCTTPFELGRSQEKTL